MYASFSFCPPDLPPESAYVSYSLSSSRYRSEAVKVYQFRTSVTCRVHFWSASVSPSRPLNRSMIRFTCKNFCSEYWSSRSYPADTASSVQARRSARKSLISTFGVCCGSSLMYRPGL